ncbi:GntR family transcriptional regulator [Rhizobiaceae bacterium n13]|uniref:GntR family transcriptional regulator n=1 Tax=Ferirhizobium litorale TaxID=2927786 RepID=A0AAE3U1H5_9HYPH|nr:GntR family transcriptional regulator [Fererhizobium litorale]MDI7862335.1 GntR family transcriptional regulator [Fererhizobium litorale]MDI7922391.1 GntR family transcriptional regulator [Fererhizobium litorale]
MFPEDLATMRTAPNSLAPKLYRRACDALALDIRSGVLAAGARLTETGVAEHFGISRAPARQALVELERLQLLKKAEGRGYEVLQVDPEADKDQAPDVGGHLELQSRSTWEVIYPDVEIEVVSRTSIANWRINEVLLARHYGVSRTVARDVVARLQERGIVRKDASSRWYAPALTERHIDELYELRWVLEPLALRKALPHVQEGLLATFQANIEMTMAMPEVRSEQLDQLEQELHVDLLGRCENQALLRAVSLPQALLVAHHFLYRRTSQLFESEPFLPEHLKIITLLRHRDITGACEALVEHLKVSRHRAMLRIRAVAETVKPAVLPYLERL